MLLLVALRGLLLSGLKFSAFPYLLHLNAVMMTTRRERYYVIGSIFKEESITGEKEEDCMFIAYSFLSSENSVV